MGTAKAAPILARTTSGDAVIVIAAEAREIGQLDRWSRVDRRFDTRLLYAGDTRLNGQHHILLANGPGPALVRAALAPYHTASALMSIGFCGALDPALRVGDIVVAGEVPRRASLPFAAGEILSVDRVIVSAAEKRRLREETGAAVVEMESAAVAETAAAWGVPYRAVKVVSDTADQSLPLDFNEYRGRDGRFQLARIALAGAMRPFRVLPELMRLDRQSKVAAERLGAFLADCQY